MIDADYARLKARYNAWQNGQLMPVLAAMDDNTLTEDRGGFFGGILATANHVLWGDTIWMSRFEPSMGPPEGGIPESVGMHATVVAWCEDQKRMDDAIQAWADGLDTVDLQGELMWYSRVMGKEVQTPMAQSVVHFFNHQTHHRGQIHAMLTAIGAAAPVSDLAFMPKDV